MRTRMLLTVGDGKFVEPIYNKPEIKDNQISVKNIMTGVCRSDLDMMVGKFEVLPMDMQGHEGLAQVVQVGKNVADVVPGDYVATRGGPAYADCYNVNSTEYVKVPEASPKYILEPVACGVNIIKSAEDELSKRESKMARLLIIGTGFMAQIAYTILKIKGYNYNISVLGEHNQEFWGDMLCNKVYGMFDVVIDLSDKRTDVFDKKVLFEQGLLILGAQKKVSTDFSNLLWNACTIKFPSPRNKEFFECMQLAERLITSGQINVDNLWTNQYNRETEWQLAFSEGINRPAGYNRGYIVW